MKSRQEQQYSPSLDDCLKLLRGERDEQRLAGLLLVTKFCKGDDLASLRLVYDAVGSHFLQRLLRTGMGKPPASGSGVDNRDAYLQLSITVMAAFCRVPEIASSEDMISKVPLILEIMPQLGVPVLEECYEFLCLVTTSSDHGAEAFSESGGLKVLASQMSSFADGSRLMELAMKILGSTLSKTSQEVANDSYLSDLSIIVVSIARQFAVLQNALKFEALHLLSEIFSSKYSGPLSEALRVLVTTSWLDHVRAGVVAILQNRVAPAEKLHALILAEYMVSIRGEEWLIGQANLPECLLLVFESSRVEVAVLLNDLAYLQYEASRDTSTTAEAIFLKQRNVAIAFSLLERIIKLISTIGGEPDKSISESALIKIINGLNETIDVVLEYLKDAKEHGKNKGDDLLASVRVTGSYLAEAPDACKEKVKEVLGFMLTVQGEDEPSPFQSICFLLPMLCQITMKIEGCKALVTSGGYKAVVDCLVKLIGPSGNMLEESSRIFLACDTIMNLLLKKEQIRFVMEESTYVDLLKALLYWAVDSGDITVIMMASSLSALILDYTSEEALLNHPNFDSVSLGSLYRLIAKSLAAGRQNAFILKFCSGNLGVLLEHAMSDVTSSEMDLLEIVSS
ncbi:hypothetical protein Tsubulata_051574, partial [Turnera subulata]